jgi:hypothetical protein
VLATHLITALGGWRLTVTDRLLLLLSWLSFHPTHLSSNHPVTMDDFPLPEPPSKDRNLLAIELVSGSVGGAAQVISGQVSPILDLRSNTDPKPLDTLKTRAQTAPRGQFKNTLDIFKTTVRNEGILALYKGASEVDRSVY